MSNYDIDVPDFDPAEWMGDAACKGKPTDWFFPERGQSLREQKAVCAGCPVRQACLDYALEFRVRFGIWGGTSEQERRRLRLVQSRGPRRSTAVCGTLGGYDKHRRTGEPPCDPCRACKTASNAEYRARKAQLRVVEP